MPPLTPTPTLPDIDAAPRRVRIETWGCQMNVYDSARMAEALAPLGYGPAEGREDADLVLLNTCHIREKASEKLFSELGRLRMVKQERAQRGSRTLIAVAGCVAQAEGREILARAPFVDIVLGSQVTHRLPELVRRAEAGERALSDTEFPPEDKFDVLPEARAAQGPAAFLTIQEGCDKFCAFCVVPYTRGAEFSRPVEAILREARQLLSLGARELVLLGQNVNAFHGEGPDGRSWSLARLLAALADLPDALRLRYTTSHPRDMSDDLVAAHRTVPALLPHLHLPVQSGSDAMLARMNRRHTREEYLRIVERLRDARPDLALTSDFITGHPGETAADHEATLDLVRRVGFAGSFTFRYSARPGTPAADARDPVPEALAHARLLELQALITAQTEAHQRAQVGLVQPVLVTGPGRYEGQLAGRSPHLLPVFLDAPRGRDPATLIGTVQPVTIVRDHPHSLEGRLHTTKERTQPVPEAAPA